MRTIRTIPVIIMSRLSHVTACVLVLATVAKPPAAAAAPAVVNCRAAHGMTEQTICASPEYVAMDREVTALVDLAAARFAPVDRQRLAASQASYLRQRAGCDWASHHSAHPGAAVDECVRSVMDRRVQILRNAVDRGSL